jgi:hypothetical protein
MNAPRRIGIQVPKVAGKALGKRGLAFGALLAEWPSIVGPRLSDQAVPAKLAFPTGRKEEAVLTLTVTAASALVIQHEEPLIVERINGFFGYRAVARLKLVHGVPTAKPKRAPKPPPLLSEQQEETLARQTGTIEEPELRDALARLGRALHGR